jgi:AMP deaminase
LNNSCHCTLPDGVVNEPDPVTNPFDQEIPPAANYQLKMVHGVMHIYKTGDDKPIFGPIHSTMEFISDQNMLFALIADGPL